MSNHLAVATVTAALSELLRPAVKQVSGADVSIERPDDLPPQNSNTGVNLFLYQVAPNAAYRNAAFLAADASTLVTMNHLLAATRTEYSKLEKSLSTAETRDWV